MRSIQELIDIRRRLEAELAGINLEIAMALGEREEAKRYQTDMYAFVQARRAAREVGLVA